ncbi:MAG TPA: hypothetical protein VMS17_01025 [Gemmataceae bacterium]|nr:hypothetical protein [Gemmataceae bacterium]
MPAVAPAARSAADGTVLRQRLAALRRRIRRTAIIRGVSRLVLFTAVMAVGVCYFDWQWHLHSLIRAELLVFWLASMGLLAWRYLYQPLSQRCNDLSLALRLEERFPALNDALASTVQFLDVPDGAGGESASLRGEAVKRTLTRAKSYDFNRIVDARYLRTIAACAALAAVGAVTLALIWPGPAYSGLTRLLNPFNNRDLPPKSLVTLIPNSPPSRVSKGEPYEINARITGFLPPNAKAKVIVHMDGYSTREYATDVVAQDDKSAKLEFRLDNVESSFHFRVGYNDFETKEYAVQVVPPPGFAEQGLWPQVQLFPPAYTQLPSPQAQPPGQGEVNAVLGTRVVVRAAVDRPLRAAWIDYPGVPKAAAGALGMAGAQASAAGAVIRAPAVLDENRTSFTVDFTPRQSGLYALHFEDETGLGATHHFGLNILEDPAPTVTLDRPSSQRDVLTVLPTAELPLQATAADPFYGLRSVRLEYHLQSDATARQQLMLHDAAKAAGPSAEAVPANQRPTRLEFNQTLSMASLHRPDGKPLQENDVVVLQAVADDWDDVSPDKAPGRSAEVEIHIVGAEAFKQQWDQEDQELQQELIRLREKQQQALEAAEAAEDRLKQIEKIQPTEGDQSEHAKKGQAEVAKLQKDVADQLSKAQQRQREIKEGVGDADHGARARAARLLESLKQNGKSTNEPSHDRLERTDQELRKIAEEQLPPIDPKLAQALKEAELLDAKNKAEFQKQKAEQAADLERQAREAEQEAERLDSRAKVAADAAEKKQLQDEAQRERDRAAARRQEADQERQEAKADTPAAGLQQKTARTEAAQQEVEKTLSDLISFSSTRDAKVKGARILDQERKLANDAGQLQNQEQDDKQLGKDPKDLPQAQSDQLAALGNEQKRLEEQAQQMLDRMKRTTELPKEAEKLAKDQEDLEQQIKRAGPKELEPLAQEQKKLADQARKKADELKELGAGKAAAAMKQAADAMDRDAERLKKGQKPEDADAAAKALKNAQKETDPKGAEILRGALDRMQQPDLNDPEETGVQGDMMKAREALSKNRLSEAKKNQDRAAKKLQDMLNQVSAREEGQREEDLDQLAKNLADKQKELKKLQDDQDELQKKIKDAKDAKELQQLAKRQKELAQETKQAADELQRLGAERAAAAAKQAAEAMDNDADRLEKGEKPMDDNQALDRLQDAQDEADDAKQDAQDRLEREKQARIADEVDGIKKRQEDLNAETERIRDTLAQNKGTRDTVIVSLAELVDSQQDLAAETESLAKKELADAPVLLRLLLRASESMTEAGKLLDEGRQAKPAQVGETAIQAQREALHRLSLALDALKSEDQALPKGGGGQGGGAAQGGVDADTLPDSVPPLAQLKALRAMQKEVNDRTAAFEKANPDPTKYGDKEKAELETIQKEQQDVIDLVEAFRRPAPPKPDGDKPKRDGDKAKPEGDKPKRDGDMKM